MFNAFTLQHILLTSLIFLLEGRDERNMKATLFEMLPVQSSTRGLDAEKLREDAPRGNIQRKQFVIMYCLEHDRGARGSVVG
jgi:hypothetical protein